MTDFPKSATVVVIGGGVMGASTAYHLAKRGCTDVVLVEKQEFFGMGATGRCAGGIRYQFSTEINIRLSLLSLPMLDRFEDELGQNIGIRRDGYLFILTNEHDVEVFRRNVALQHSLGVQTEWLCGDDVRRRVPQLVAGDVIAGAFHDKDGLADPNSVVMGYVNAARRLGVRVYTETGVSAIDTTSDGGKVVGVQTSRGAITCEVVVNAAGPWAAPISATAGVELPIIPLRRQIMTTTPLPELAPRLSLCARLCAEPLLSSRGRGHPYRPEQPERAAWL